MSLSSGLAIQSPAERNAPDERFAVLRRVRRVWAIASVHGEATRLARLHGALAERFEPSDRFVYLGNYFGYGGEIRATVDELLRFRRVVLAQPPYTHLDDIVYLRGRQEEMWRKLLQLQFAGDCRKVLAWMLERGVGPTLEAYGGTAADAEIAIKDGLLSVTRWTGRLRGNIRACPGHYEFLAALRRAAYTEDGALLFVSAGLDPAKGLDEQADGFWWNSHGFDRIPVGGFASFRRVVRGFDPEHRGIVEGPGSLSIDGGVAFGGVLNAVCLDAGGEVLERIEA